MRQGQQNRRGRGRNNNNNNNNRKGQNPLTRSFESNGPDVKIRGTPSHIAEKYISLARDAQSSGDPVLAENYLQHAEHYNRIIMAYREQQIQHGGDPGVAMVRRPQMSGEFVDGEEFDDDGEDSGADAGGGTGQPVMGVNEPQPVVRAFDPQQRHEGGRQDHRHEGRNEHRGPRHEGGNRDNRNEGRRGDFHLRPHRDRHHGQGGSGRDVDGNPQGQPRGDFRQERHERRSSEGFQPREPREHREPREPREPRPEPRLEPRAEPRQESRVEPRIEDRADVRVDRVEPRGEAGPRREHQPRPRRDQFGAGSEQPEFLRRPVRRPRRESPAEEGAAAAPAPEPAATADDTAE